MSKVEVEERQEDEDCHYYTIPLTKKTRPFLLWVVGLFLCPVLEPIFMRDPINLVLLRWYDGVDGEEEMYGCLKLCLTN